MTYLLVDMTSTTHDSESRFRDVWQALERLPTLTIGQEDDLKLAPEGLRFWLSRVNQGELAIEVFMDDEWREVWHGTLI